MYDIAIIGGGPGGYVAAEKAGKNGLKTVLFEKKDLGGVCLNEGCIPTKTLLNCAKHYRYAVESAGLGVTVEGAKLDHAKVVERKNKVVKTLVSGIGAKMKGAGVTVVPATAVITGKTADGFTVKSGVRTFEAAAWLRRQGADPTEVRRFFQEDRESFTIKSRA